MDLYIVRHAQAGHYGDPQWPDDSERPLTKEGKKRFAEMIERLARRDFAPEIIATSPMVRCRQTAELVAGCVPGDPEVVPLDALLPGADLEALIAWTSARLDAAREIAWVGHAPDVNRLVAELIGEGEAEIRFAKGAIAAIRFHGPPEIARGELRWLVTTKILGC